MNQYHSLRRLAAAVTAFVIMGGVLVFAVTSNRPTGAQPGGQPSEGRPNPWPMWGGSLSRNMVNLVEKNLPVSWDVDEKTNMLWAQDLGSKAYGGPSIGDGKIFIGTNNEKPRDPNVKGDKGIIMCFEERTGKFLWQRVHDKLPSGQVQDWPKEGICSTPAVDGKKIYYVSNRCELVCATTDGKDVWSLDMIKELGVFPHNLATSSPLVAGDMVFVVTSNGVNENHIDIPAPAAPSFIGVNKNTGKTVWVNNDPTKRLLFAKDEKDREALIKTLVNKGEVMMHGQWSSPCYAEVGGQGQVIFPGGDGWLRSFNPKSGELIWSFDCNPKNSIYELGAFGTRNDFISTPVVHDNKVFIGVGQDPEHAKGIGHFWCIDITKKGDVSPKNDNFDPKAAENKDSALVWHYGEPAPKEWRPKNRDYVFGRTMSTAAVHDGLVYIAELHGYVHCLDAKTGQQYWLHDLRSATWCSTSLIDGKVYIGSDGSEVHILEHAKKKKLIAALDMPGQVRATPVAANGILYITAGNKLYGIGNKK